MSLFSWFAPKKKKSERDRASAPVSSGLSRMDSTKPLAASRQASGEAQPANRKHERMARRELLYAIVREGMVRAGVLSSSYKFKVLSLDSRGRQFLVMIDLAHGAGGETARLAEIEAMIAQMAKSRHDILVSAVYWRSNEHVAVGEPQVRPVHRPTPSRPAPLQPEPRAARLPEVPPGPSFDAVSQPAELTAAPAQPQRATPAGFEPLLPDEILAFRQALASGVRSAPSAAAVPPIAGDAPVPARGVEAAARPGPQSYTLLTGFEDTEMPAAPNEAALSATQYGELR